MATEFLRLYRELGRYDIHHPPDDIEYEKDRKYIFNKLGHDVGDIRQAVKAPKYHGRMARRRLREKLNDGLNIDRKLEFERTKQLLKITTQNNEVRELLSVIDQNKQNPSKVNDAVWNKYETLFPKNEIKDTAPPPNTQVMLKDTSLQDLRSSKDMRQSSQTLKSILPPMRVSHRKNIPLVPTIKRSVTVIRKDFTQYKWTKEERNRLNALYWDVNKPLMNTNEAWNDYVQQFAARFKEYYPSKETDDIIEKLRQFIKFRSMKEPGEKEFWGKISKSSS
jgi:hypothetical protein